MVDDANILKVYEGRGGTTERNKVLMGFLFLSCISTSTSTTKLSNFFSNSRIVVTQSINPTALFSNYSSLIKITDNTYPVQVSSFLFYVVRRHCKSLFTLVGISVVQLGNMMTRRSLEVITHDPSIYLSISFQIHINILLLPLILQIITCSYIYKQGALSS